MFSWIEVGQSYHCSAKIDGRTLLSVEPLWLTTSLVLSFPGRAGYGTRNDHIL